MQFSACSSGVRTSTSCTSGDAIILLNSSTPTEVKVGVLDDVQEQMTLPPNKRSESRGVMKFLLFIIVGENCICAKVRRNFVMLNF